jgi:hypothetical protein
MFNEQILELTYEMFGEYLVPGSIPGQFTCVSETGHGITAVNSKYTMDESPMASHDHRHFPEVVFRVHGLVAVACLEN